MENLILAAFLTGLTTGGLSCFALQGGLLTGSIAHQLEPAAIPVTGAPRSKPAKRTAPTQNIQPAVSTQAMTLTVTLFLAAKLLVYTLLGFFLGWLGSIFSFSPFVKGAIQILIGIFLLGNALRLFKVHPIFRYFSFEPPSAATRFVRRVSKGNDRLATPLFLGALTILIPCGVTQAAMAVAVGTGDPLTGAAVMFAFILGTSPTFFGVTVLAAGMAKTFNRYFMPVVSVFVLILGLVTIDGGLNVIGSPISSQAILRGLGAAPTAESAPAASSSEPLSSDLRINVTNSGYIPGSLPAPANQPVNLLLVTNKSYSCARDFMIPTLGIQKLLPATGEVTITLPAQKTGTILRFTCSMGMYTGVIRFQ